MALGVQGLASVVADVGVVAAVGEEEASNAVMVTPVCIIHTMSHPHTYYVTSSYILCHIILHWSRLCATFWGVRVWRKRRRRRRRRRKRRRKRRREEEEEETCKGEPEECGEHPCSKRTHSIVREHILW